MEILLFFMIIFSSQWVFFLAPPSFHYFKAISNTDSGQTPPSYSAIFIIFTVVFCLKASLNPSDSVSFALGWIKFRKGID